MNIIKVIGRNQLKELLSLDRVNSDNTLIVDMLGIGNIKNDVPKSYILYLYKSILIPTTSIINTYYQEGISENFIDQCVSHWSRPDVLFFINEVIRRAAMDDYNVAIVTSSEENDDFHTLDMLCDRIDTMYRIKAISFKKFKKGKSSKLGADQEDIFEVCDSLREEIIRKLNVLGIELPRNLFMRITKKMLKKFPKEVRNAYKQYIEEDEE